MSFFSAPWKISSPLTGSWRVRSRGRMAESGLSSTGARGIVGHFRTTVAAFTSAPLMVCHRRPTRSRRTRRFPRGTMASGGIHTRSVGHDGSKAGTCAGSGLRCGRAVQVPSLQSPKQPKCATGSFATPTFPSFVPAQRRHRSRCNNSHFFAPALSSVPRSRCGGCIGICSRSIGPPESTTTRPCWCCSYSGTKLWAWSTRLLTYSWASTATTISPTWSGRCVKEGTSLQRTRWVQRGPCGVGATAGRGAWTRAHRRLFLGTPSAGVSKSFRLRRFVVRPG
mmetsp:Transcript_107877/g.303944  ORF Transcript_107877/g.303944 Transcript_107877/m.303944 type:complete len:281 (-) Transcript_107877:533-1375(-)